MLQTYSDHDNVGSQHCLIIDLTTFVTQTSLKTTYRDLREDGKIQYLFKTEMLMVLTVLNQGPCLFL